MDSVATQPSLDFGSSSSSSGTPDSDLLHTFTPMGTVEDFFNFDLLNAPQAGESSSRSSSRSPQHNTWNLPPTPELVPGPAPDVATNVDPLFQSLYSESAQKEQQGLFSFLDGPMAFSPSAFTNIQSFEEPTLAIDPQLTANTPSSSGENSSSSDSKPMGDEDFELLDEEQDDISPLPVIKVGGKGKSNRKGTIVSGGIRKNQQPMTQAVRKDGDPEDDDDWRPTAEEYKKMSSKEKRQLRNKISARNFRVRRKEYISTLEGDIAQRDSLIDIIRTELSSTKLENQSLRREVEGLKKALMKGGITPNLPPPAPLSETIPASALKDNTNTTPATKRQAALATPNTKKDLPLSPRMGGNAFWGGRSAFPGTGITPVHTTLVPEFSPFIPDKLAARAKAQSSDYVSQQENINPNLNANPFFGIGHLSNAASNVGKDKMSMSGFDGYNDANLFNFRNMDTYRMHLWERIGNNRPVSHSANNGISNPSMFVSNNNNGLASHLRPLNFASPSAKSLKDSSSPTESKASTPSHTPQQAIIASLVSQSFMQKLTSSFWDAFSSPSHAAAVSPSNKKDWDIEKVRKVIEGKAVLRVVDVPSSSKKSPSASEASVEALEQSLKDLAISSQKAASGSSNSSSSPRGSPPMKEKMMLRPEPCFLTGLRNGTSPLCSKKTIKQENGH